MIRAVLGPLAGLTLICAASWAVLQIVLRPGEARLSAVIEENVALAVRRADLMARVATLEAATRQVGIPAGLLWEASGKSEAELAIQTAILQSAEAQGLRLFSYGPAAKPLEVTSEALGYQIEGEAAWTLLLKFLQAAETIQPALALSELYLRATPVDPASPTEGRVAFRIVFWGFGPSIEAAP